MASKTIKLDCPMCESRIGKKDFKAHLNINETKGVFHCFRCNWGGKLTNSSYEEFKLLSKNDEEKGELDFLESKLQKLFTILDTKEFDLNQISWPLTEEQCPYAYAYIKGRGISGEEISQNNIRVGKNYHNGQFEVKKWGGRIIFPYINPYGACTYIVGRAYSGKDPKYLNCKNNKDFVVYGLNKVSSDTPVILCEGIISSIVAQRVTGVQSVAVLGKLVTEGQLSLLRSRTSSLIVSLDGDVDRYTRDKLNKQLLILGFENIEEVILPPDKDPDDLREEYLTYFNKRVPVNLF